MQESGVRDGTLTPRKALAVGIDKPQTCDVNLFPGSIASQTQILKVIEMAQCYFCGAETVLLDSGTPICVKCDNEREQKKNLPYRPRNRDNQQPETRET